MLPFTMFRSRPWQPLPGRSLHSVPVPSFPTLCELCVSAFSSLSCVCRCRALARLSFTRRQADRVSFAASQKSIPLSAFPATLASHVNHNSLICHSYEKTRGVGVSHQEFLLFHSSVLSANSVPSALKSPSISSIYLRGCGTRVTTPAESALLIVD
jgi:hypothetical protein